jgi:hypothetical protein
MTAYPDVTYTTMSQAVADFDYRNRLPDMHYGSTTKNGMVCATAICKMERNTQ